MPFCSYLYRSEAIYTSHSMELDREIIFIYVPSVCNSIVSRSSKLLKIAITFWYLYSFYFYYCHKKKTIDTFRIHLVVLQFIRIREVGMFDPDNLFSCQCAGSIYLFEIKWNHVLIVISY